MQLIKPLSVRVRPKKVLTVPVYFINSTKPSVFRKSDLEFGMLEKIKKEEGCFGIEKVDTSAF